MNALASFCLASLLFISQSPQESSELKEAAESAVLHSEFFPDSTVLQSKWDEHQNGVRDHNRALWAILMLETWKDQFAVGL